MQKTKTLSGRVNVKNAELGEVEAVFATLNVKDHDGDVIEPGAITDGASVVISPYGHKVWSDHPPVGVGTIHEVGNELVMKGRYFLDTDAGRNDFHTVKGLAEAGKGEWSFGLVNIKATKDTKNGISANFIQSVDVPEVSPVFIGAGIDTRTLVAKGRKEWNSTLSDKLREAGVERYGSNDQHVWVADHDVDAGLAIFEVYGNGDERLVQVDYSVDGDDLTLGSGEVEVERETSYAPKTGVKFSEHLAAVLADVKALNARAEEVVALRAAKGKTIGDDTAEQIAAIGDELERIKALIGTPATPPPADDFDVNAEFARFVAISQGVTL